MAKVQFSLFVFWLLSVAHVWCWQWQSPSHSHTQLLRQFNSGHDSLYQGGNENAHGPVFDEKACAYPAPDAVENAEVQCSTYSGCRVQCFRGYTMHGSRRQYLNCDTKTHTLTYDGLPWEESLPPCIPSCENGCPGDTMCVAPNKCEPVNHECDPPCQNGGACIIPGVCNCSLGYSGLLCEEHRCDIPHVLPKHGSIGADTELTRMSVECNFGHKMKNGLSHEIFICNHRQWYTKAKKESIGDVDIDCY
ncbi:uncharacterized protein [Palaemon carinicauda]|uniref:uncharacterized protein n=1 Tax=Palaemon carinicauda TaxID=392227 RepID=UPI0035B628CE